MAQLSRNVCASSRRRLNPSKGLAVGDVERGCLSSDDLGDALIVDAKTGRYKLKRSIFDQLLAEAAETIWSHRRD